MRPHHTKNKGDLGLLHAQLDLARKGFGILLPMTEHEAFDLVAYKDHTFYRVQVKYRAVTKGHVYVRLTSSWTDRHGTRHVPMDRSAVDVVCIYCPQTGLCYYIDPSRWKENVALRIDPPRNAQAKRIHWASDHLDVPEVRGVPAVSRLGLVDDAVVRQIP